MPLDKRTYIIIVVIILVLLPLVIYVFRGSFFPWFASLKSIFSSADLYQGSGTGLPIKVLNSLK